MRYLYGDSSAFPLNDNFIETLSSGTDAAVALLEADAALDKAKRVSAEATKKATTELADIDAISRRMEAALTETDAYSKATKKVAHDVHQSAKQQFELARASIKRWRTATLTEAANECGAAAIMAPLHHFLLKHQLPYTSWGLRWKSGQGEEPVQAQVYAIMQRGLTATLAVGIPKKHPWAQSVRVAVLEKKLCIQMKRKGLFGKERLRDEHLDRYWITRVTSTADRDALILSKKAKDPSDGLRISFREGDAKRVMIVRIDENEVPTSEPVLLEGIDAALVQRLWNRVEETITNLVEHRSHLLVATIYGKSITEVERPATVAVAIIKAIAPLVRDMKRHSQTREELCLKRELGDGRREELFISHAEIRNKWARLTQKRQVLFTEYGIGQPERTSELHSAVPSKRPERIAQPQPTPTPASQPAPAPTPTLQPAPTPAPQPAPTPPSVVLPPPAQRAVELDMAIEVELEPMPANSSPAAYDYAAPPQQDWRHSSYDPRRAGFKSSAPPPPLQSSPPLSSVPSADQTATAPGIHALTAPPRQLNANETPPSERPPSSSRRPIFELPPPSVPSPRRVIAS